MTLSGLEEISKKDKTKKKIKISNYVSPLFWILIFHVSNLLEKPFPSRIKNTCVFFLFIVIRLTKKRSIFIILDFLKNST